MNIPKWLSVTIGIIAVVLLIASIVNVAPLIFSCRYCKLDESDIISLSGLVISLISVVLVVYALLQTQHTINVQKEQLDREKEERKNEKTQNTIELLLEQFLIKQDEVYKLVNDGNLVQTNQINLSQRVVIYDNSSEISEADRKYAQKAFYNDYKRILSKIGNILSPIIRINRLMNIATISNDFKLMVSFRILAFNDKDNFSEKLSKLYHDIKYIYKHYDIYQIKSLDNYLLSYRLLIQKARENIDKLSS